MRFHLTIDLKNAATQTGTDLAGALRDLADGFADDNGSEPPEPTTGNVRDANGNTVGTWTVTKDA